MNLNDISTQLLYTTLPIWIEYKDGKQGSATGFIFTMPAKENPQLSIPLLVTNHHVVKDAKRVMIEFVARGANAPVIGKRVPIVIEGEVVFSFSDPYSDLAALPIAPIVNQLEQTDQPVFFRSITPDLMPTADVLHDLAAIEDVVFIGYPSGLYDQHNVTPIVRRGITATPVWNHFQGQPLFLIDAGVFQGSSGSPVFLFNQGSYSTRAGLIVGNRLLFLGVISETIVRSEPGTPNVFLGLGKVINSRQIQTFVEGIIKELPQSTDEPTEDAAA